MNYIVYLGTIQADFYKFCNKTYTGNVRMYDPALGRFLSPDPFMQDPSNTQNFNRYSYCLNNPLKFIDPSGFVYSGATPHSYYSSPSYPIAYGNYSGSISLQFRSSWDSDWGDLIASGIDPKWISKIKFNHGKKHSGNGSSEVEVPLGIPTDYRKIDTPIGTGYANYSTGNVLFPIYNDDAMYGYGNSDHIYISGNTAQWLTGSTNVYDENPIGYITYTPIKFENSNISETDEVHDISDAGLKFIAKFEGFSATVYRDVAGFPTIGYGHLIKKGEYFNSLTKAQALQLLNKDAAFAVNAVDKYVSVSLNQNQFDALASFTFNLGAGALSKSSLLKNINSGNILSINELFMVWNKARIDGVLKPVRGLTIRRQAEANLFLYGDY